MFDFYYDKLRRPVSSSQRVAPNGGSVEGKWPAEAFLWPSFQLNLRNQTERDALHNKSRNQSLVPK